MLNFLFIFIKTGTQFVQLNIFYRFLSLEIEIFIKTSVLKLFMCMEVVDSPVK